MSLEDIESQPERAKRKYTLRQLPEPMPVTDADMIMTDKEFCRVFRFKDGWTLRNRLLKHNPEKKHLVVPHFYVGRQPRYVLSACIEHFKKLGDA